MTVVVWFGVALIGGAGSVLRFLVDGAVTAAHRRRLPIGTLVVNLGGAVVLGLLAGLALHGRVLLLAGTAAVGSYTTFSTWMLESQRLDEERQHGVAVTNVVVSLLAGLLAVAVGKWIGGQL